LNQERTLGRIDKLRCISQEPDEVGRVGYNEKKKGKGGKAPLDEKGRSGPLGGLLVRLKNLGRRGCPSGKERKSHGARRLCTILVKLTISLLPPKSFGQKGRKHSVQGSSSTGVFAWVGDRAFTMKRRKAHVRRRIPLGKKRKSSNRGCASKIIPRSYGKKKFSQAPLGEKKNQIPPKFFFSELGGWVQPGMFQSRAVSL